MIWLLRRLVVAPAVILLTVLVWVTLPLWLIVAAALSPVVPGRWRAARPARWVTAAREARSVTSRVRPAPRS